METFPTGNRRAKQEKAVPPSDYDSPWKEAIEQYFPAFLVFFFPEIYAGIDWNKEYVFLDKELERVVRDATLGHRYWSRSSCWTETRPGC